MRGEYSTLHNTTKRKKNIISANTDYYEYMHFFCHSLRLSFVTLSLVGFPPCSAPVLAPVQRAIVETKGKKNEGAVKNAKRIR
jgi:hypothetical protein